jgi:hypothetical protein
LALAVPDEVAPKLKTGARMLSETVRDAGLVHLGAGRTSPITFRMVSDRCRSAAAAGKRSTTSVGVPTLRTRAANGLRGGGDGKVLKRG